MIGFLMLLLGGVILPYLMTIHVIDVTAINEVLAWVLIFGSYAMSVVGLFLGVIGFATYTRSKRTPK